MANSVGTDFGFFGFISVIGLFPGKLFAAIPVTQVFHRFTAHRFVWKRSLLFIQFTGIAFILGLLMVILLQYHQVMTRDMGI